MMPEGERRRWGGRGREDGARISRLLRNVAEEKVRHRKREEDRTSISMPMTSVSQTPQPANEAQRHAEAHLHPLH